MSNLTDEQIHDIQERFRQFQHFPRLYELSKEYHITINRVLEVINQNPRIGAFLYRNSVYTWRHVRQFEYMLNSGEPLADIARYFGIGSEQGIKLMKRKIRELMRIENREPKNKEEEHNMATPEEMEPYQLTDLDKKVIELSKKGMSQRGVAEELGVSRSKVFSVLNNLKERGCITTEEIMGERREIRNKDISVLNGVERKVVELYNSGVYNVEIMKALGISKRKLNNIISVLRKNGYIPDKKISIQKPEREDTIEKYDLPKEPKQTEKKEAPDNDKDIPELDNKEHVNESPNIVKVTRSERIDKLADELVQKLKVSRSAAGKALSAARDAIEYVFKFGDVNSYTINGNDSEVTISLHGDLYDFAMTRKLNN